MFRPLRELKRPQIVKSKDRILPGPVQIGDVVGKRSGEYIFPVVVATDLPGYNGTRVIIVNPDRPEYWEQADVKDLVPASEMALIMALKGIQDE